MIVSNLAVPNEEQIQLLLKLADRVREADGVQLPIAVHLFQPGPQQATVRAVMDQNKMIGALVVMRFREPEAMIFVDPDHRRKGIGTALVESYREELRGQNDLSGLLVADLASSSVEPFLRTVGFLFEEAEYQMEISSIPVDQAPAPADLALRRATNKDRDALLAVHNAAFGQLAEGAAERLEVILAEEKRHFVLAEVKEEVVGMVRRGEWDGIGDITALGVVPKWRGQGIGRALLIDATRWLFQQGFSKVALEVATDNPNALQLYRSVGFEETAKFGYYRVKAN
jgi:mycothiol synthase